MTEDRYIKLSTERVTSLRATRIYVLKTVLLMKQFYLWPHTSNEIAICGKKYGIAGR